MPGANDANGIYRYAEDDQITTISAYLGKLAASVSTAVGLIRARLTSLEARTTGRFTPAVANTSTAGLTANTVITQLTERDSYGTISIVYVIRRPSGTWGDGDLLGYIPAGFRPPVGLTMNAATAGAAVPKPVIVEISATDGSIRVYGGGGNTVCTIATRYPTVV